MSGRHFPSVSHARTLNTNIKNTDTNNDKGPESSRVSSDEIKTDRRCQRDMETMAAEKLAEQATTLMKLKFICALLAILTLINTATFGALTHAVIKRLDHNEQRTGTLQSQITTAGEFVALSDIRTRVSELEANFSDTHLNHSFRIHQLEIDLAADKNHIQKHDAQIQQLEIQTDYINESTLQINNYLNSLNATYYTDRQLYSAQQTGNLTFIDEFGERLETLELNQTEYFRTVLDHTIQLNEFEMNWTASQSLLHEHQSQIDQIQGNLTSNSLMLYTYKNDMLLLYSNIQQFDNHLNAQNATVKAVLDRLSQLENDTKEARKLTEIQVLKLAQHEEILVSTNETLLSQNIRLVQLENDQKINHDMIVNNSAKIAELEIISNQTLKLGLLEMELLSLNDIIRNQTDKIEEMRMDADAQNESLNSNKGRIEELESRQNVDELQSVNQSVRIANLEFNRQSDLGRILEMGQIAYVTQQTLNDVHIQLTNITDELNCSLGVWSDFSPCSHTCGSGTKYRTRSCQNTTEESRDWYPRKETDIQVCNDQECPVNQIGFSAQGNTIDTDNVVKFESVITNYGSSYSLSTGKFTCSQPGLYFFSASLIKDRDYASPVDLISCLIYQNTNMLIETLIDPTDDDTDLGSYETSAFLSVYLSAGDQVYVKCSAGRLSWYSYFSGFMIQPD